ncbi:MAG TPA: LytTR family transcriptional regulator DNA-binding domain-containing protein [Steroidobacteraceae bacterium]
MSELIREPPRIFREGRHVVFPPVCGGDVVRPSPHTVLAIAVIAATFMAIVGPFGTWMEPLPERLGFWIIGVVASVWVGFGLDRCLRRVVWFRHRPTIRALTNVALFAAPAGLIASSAASLIQGAPINWALYWQTVPQMLLVGFGFVGLFHLAARRNVPAASRITDDPTMGGLLPLKLSGARLLAMEAEDHYVRIHTDRGASLILTAFETALTKVAQLDGMRIHRSWWVARAAVVGIQRDDGRAVLEAGTYWPSTFSGLNGGSPRSQELERRSIPEGKS